MLDLLGGAPIKGQLQGAHLVQNDPEGPDVGCEGEGFPGYNLGRKILYSSGGERFTLILVLIASDAEIAQLYLISPAEEEVGRF